MAVIGLVLVEGLAVALALVAPNKLLTALIAGLSLPALWMMAELAKGDKTYRRFAIAVSAALLAVPLVTQLAKALGWIGAGDGDLSSRLFGIAGGLILAAYGNVIPRQLERYDPGKIDPARWQRLQRRAAWAFVLAGLACAAIYALLPVRAAALWSTVPVAVAILLVLPMIVICLRGRKA
jgi:hypothetical protein